MKCFNDLQFFFRALQKLEHVTDKETHKTENVSDELIYVHKCAYMYKRQAGYKMCIMILNLAG